MTHTGFLLKLKKETGKTPTEYPLSIKVSIPSWGTVTLRFAFLRATSSPAKKFAHSRHDSPICFASWLSQRTAFGSSPPDLISAQVKSTPKACFSKGCFRKKPIEREISTAIEK